MLDFYLDLKGQIIGPECYLPVVTNNKNYGLKCRLVCRLAPLVSETSIKKELMKLL